MRWAANHKQAMNRGLNRIWILPQNKLASRARVELMRCGSRLVTGRVPTYPFPEALPDPNKVNITVPCFFFKVNARSTIWSAIVMPSADGPRVPVTTSSGRARLAQRRASRRVRQTTTPTAPSKVGVAPWISAESSVRLHGRVDIKFRPERKPHFPSAQLMLRQMHLTNVSESIEAVVLSFLAKF